MEVEEQKSEKGTRGKAAIPSSFLPNGRKRRCGVWTLEGTRKAPSPSMTVQGSPRKDAIARRKYTRLRCKCWECSLCGPRKARMLRGQILRAVERKKMQRMLTLTLDAKKFVSEEDRPIFFEHYEAHKALKTACKCPTCRRVQLQSIRHIRECWRKLRVYLKRKFGVAPDYICVLEFQKASGLAHLHIAIDRYVDQSWAKKSWSALGGGEHVDIRQRDVHRMGSYLGKYLAKELLLGAPSGMRRATTSRSISLDDRGPSERAWVVIRWGIDRVYVYLKAVAENPEFVEEELDSFTVRE